MEQKVGERLRQTYVARVIAAVDPEATIIPLRVLDPDGVGNVWVVAEALRYAINPDGNFPAADGGHPITLSIGTQRQTRLLREIVDDVRGRSESPAWGRGVVIVAAADIAGTTHPRVSRGGGRP